MKVYRVKLASMGNAITVLGDSCAADQASGVLRISERRKYQGEWVHEDVLTAAHLKWEWARLVDERDD